MVDTTSKKSRNVFLDCLRGIVIFLMIWGHCIQYMNPSGLDFFENPIFKIIYSFHMPCFALISGYLLWYSFNKENIHASLGKRIIVLIIPIVFAHFLNVIINFLPKFIFQFNINTCIQFVKNMGSLSSLWFFWSVLASVIAVACAKSISQKTHVQLLLLFLLTPLVYTLPNGVLNVFIYPYVVIGYYFVELKKYISEKAIKIIGCATIPVFVVMMFFFEKKHYIYITGLYSSAYSVTQNLSINLFRYAIGLIGSIAFISTTLLIVQFFKKGNFFTYKKDFYFGINLLGIKSLQIYALSCSLLSIYLPRISRFIYEKALTIDVFLENNLLVFNFVLTPAVAIIYCIGLYFIIFILEKIRISKYIYGK